MRKGEITIGVIIIGLLLTVIGGLVDLSVEKESRDSNTTKEASQIDDNN